MNIFKHYMTTRECEGRYVSLLSMLPDIYVALQKVAPTKAIKRHALMMHRKADFKNRSIQKAWMYHRAQDDLSHEFVYEDLYQEMIPKDSVMLYSGGLDSFIQWRLLGCPTTVFFDIGNKAMKKEFNMYWKAMSIFCDYNNINSGSRFTFTNTELKQYAIEMEMNNGYIPYRNLLFIILASKYSNNIVLSQIAEWAPDKNRRFFNHTEKLLKEAMTGAFQNVNQKVKIYTPFSDLTKTKLVAEYLRVFGPIDGLEKSKKILTDYTYSCYSGDEIPCGKCNACISRHIALVNNGINPGQYQNDINVNALKSRLSIRDFKLSQIPMYWKRFEELRYYERHVF